MAATSFDFATWGSTITCGAQRPRRTCRLHRMSRAEKTVHARRPSERTPPRRESPRSATVRVRVPERRVAQVDDEIAVALQCERCASVSIRVRVPDRCAAIIENEVAVGLHRELEASIARFQRLTLRQT